MRMGHTSRYHHTELPSAGARKLIPILLVITVIATACSSRVVGMQSPAAHDYQEIDWQPLEAPVSQPFIVGSGYSAAVGNDSETTPEQVLARFEQLPDDARDGTLTELRAGIRPEEEPITESATPRIRIAYAPELDPRFPEDEYRAWPEDHSWLDELNRSTGYEQTFVSPYPNLDGLLVRTATFHGDLTPGPAVVGQEGADALTGPFDGDVLARLAAGEQVQVTGATEGHAAVALPDGGTGYVPLDRFASLPPPARQIDDPLTMELVPDGSNQPIRTVQVPPEEIHDNAHLAIRFDPIEKASGEAFTIRFSMAAEPGGGITLRATDQDSYADGRLFVSDEPASRDLVFRPLYNGSFPAFETAVDRLLRDGDWVTVDELPALRPGTVATVTLIPENSDESASWEFGSTPGRSPYAGWPARLADVDGESTAFPAPTSNPRLDGNGAVLFETVYEREVNAGAVVGDAFDRFATMGQSDPVFTLGFSGLLAGMATFTLIAWRRSREGAAADGR